MRYSISVAWTVVLMLLVGATPSGAQEPALVAPTNALSPAEEQMKLLVPEGLEIQLVASEPDIQKPMQMAFDAKGRIWVCTSYHYPFAAAAGRATDKLFVLSDFGADGKARKIQTFAADLNIPIGILPLPDCNSCIVSSVGEILKLTDTDGDGKADKREVLFSGFGSRDTHGMYNSYILMPDGWVYACHGFLNESTVKGKDGHEVKMRSGNTFRFRPDGSRIEVVTRGQVNPFGMCVDPWFNFYTADCHSKPITQLIPGATYESFNTTSDPLGFGPVMFGYDPGGTGMCGVTWYDADHFPASFKGNMFLGNVVTSRVNMCKIEWTGATPHAVKRPDLVTSNDPWFRPVDVKLGPDGAIYISDFYNKIIGHYEVDLKHPQRDKDHGRIWRVVKKGTSPKPARQDFTAASDSELTRDLVHPNLMVRMMAGNLLLHRIRTDKNSKPSYDVLLDLTGKPETASLAAGWAAFIAEAQNQPVNYSDLVNHAKGMKLAPDQFSTLFLRAMASREKWDNTERAVALDILKSFDAPRLTRTNVDAMAAHPHPDFVKPLVDLLAKTPGADETLRHSTKIALRNCLQESSEGWKVVKSIDERTSPWILDIAMAITTVPAYEYVSESIKTGLIPADRLPAGAEYVGRYASQNEIGSVVAGITKKWKGAQATSALQALVRGLQSRGWHVGSKPLEAVLAHIQTEIEKAPNNARIAALKLFGDLPAVLEASDRRVVTDRYTKLLQSVIGTESNAEVVRGEALDCFVKLDSKSGLTTAEKLIDSLDTSPALRERAALILAGSADRNHKQAAKDAIKSVPYRSGVVIATALAGTVAGGDILLEAVKQGKAPARVLQEKQVLDRLRAAKIDNLDRQLADLTRGLQPADQKLAGLIQQRTVRFNAAKADKEQGAKLFQKHCGACHKIGEEGGKIAPNLDGVGLRGLERLLEDILDPNRNVDVAFRARVLNLADGTTKTGLMLRIEGESLVMADDMGKEFRVPTKDIEKNRETTLSPMPANFGEVIPEAEFFNLMRYLLDQRSKEVPKK